LTAERNASPPRSVLILAHSWPPDAYVGAVRPVYLARQLARLGWQPVVVTVQERYYELKNTAGVAGTDSALVIRTRCLPNPRRAYLWLKNLVARRRRRSPALTTSSPATDEMSSPQGQGVSRSIPGRLKRTLLSLLYTPDEFQGWFPFALVASLRAVARHRPKCVISTGPPFTSHLVALALKGICGAKWVADFRDPWSWREGLPAEISSPVSDRINRSLEKIVMQRADRVVCVTPATTDRYRQLYPRLPANKWLTITNGYDMAEFAGLGPVEKPDRFTISYIGGFDFSRTPLLVLRAVGELVSAGMLDRLRVTLRFVGPCRYVGDRPVSQMIAESGLNGIAEIVGFVPRPEALKEILRANVLVLLGGTQRLSVAAKVYEYVAAGKPILAITEDGATAELIRRIGGGRVVAPNDLEGAKDAIVSWYKRYVQEGKAETLHWPQDPGIAEEYSWDRLGARYAAALEECSENK